MNELFLIIDNLEWMIRYIKFINIFNRVHMTLVEWGNKCLAFHPRWWLKQNIEFLPPARIFLKKLF
jgi:hypothetical protein